MKTTKSQKAEAARVKIFLESILSENRDVDLSELSHLAKPFSGPSSAVLHRCAQVAIAEIGLPLVDPHNVTLAALMFGWWLGREFEKRNGLERMMGEKE